ncbi:MAG: hypothetical protein AAFR02_11510 [Pseudomonadota bacterium]
MTERSYRRFSTLGRDSAPRCSAEDDGFGWHRHPPIEREPGSSTRLGVVRSVTPSGRLSAIWHGADLHQVSNGSDEATRATARTKTSLPAQEAGGAQVLPVSDVERQ